MTRQSMRPVGRPPKKLTLDMKRDYRPPHLEHYIGVRVKAYCEIKGMKEEEFWRYAYNLAFEYINELKKANEEMDKQKKAEEVAKQQITRKITR